MTNLQLAQSFMHEGDTLETVENTYRPALNGTHRRVTKVGRSYFDAVMLDGEQAGQSCRGAVPCRARDVVAVNDHTMTVRLDPAGAPARLVGHTVTYRRAVAQ